MIKYISINFDYINFWLKYKYVNIINYEIYIFYLRIFLFFIQLKLNIWYYNVFCY